MIHSLLQTSFQRAPVKVQRVLTAAARRDYPLPWSLPDRRDPPPTSYDLSSVSDVALELGQMLVDTVMLVQDVLAAGCSPSLAARWQHRA